ncbi:hypothetical protein BS50DRAFT_298096 [Corynespora cassiicola Philippines]|uniref:Phosphoribosylaminoimidazole-succinocarboxamide synthase n=1 Tax=Corynespora cassiicola Philippines TaxID=1448308 RepID=A0A2T2NWT8_CORCC|nr:hypothetical protein BS50DRAFT_298096 [Corynespora cassiicola Philippines]
MSDMSVESSFQLKQTNVSRPRLSHSDSQRSIAASQAASEGYYSVSDHASSDSDERAYHTPLLSNHRSPTQSHEQLHQPEAFATSLKGIGIPRQPDPAVYDRTHPHPQSPTVSTIAEERPETQDSRNSRLRAQMDADSVATTPGMDTTPYIRFAIDQLTRDEEVRGSRMYPVSPVGEQEEDYPVERVVSDDGLGYMAKDQQTQQRLSQHMSPRSSRRAPAQSTASADPFGSRYQTHVPELQDPAPIYLHPDIPGSHPRSQAQRDIFVPFRPSPDSLPHSPLHFLPGILRPFWLSNFTFLCALMLAALIFTAVYSNRNNGAGLWDYVAFGDNRYFVFEYLPTFLGMMILIWLFQVQAAFQRIVPFISLSSESTDQRSEAMFLSLYTRQFLLPRTEYFKAKQPLVGTCYIIFWLFTWTIPLLASSFNVKYDLDRRVWRWVAVQGVIWTVIVLYILLICALLFLLVFLSRKETGLKWDPRSLADIIALLERSNIMGDYAGSETFEKKDWDQLRSRADRIGYWSTTKRPNDIFYGIGEDGGATRRYSLERGKIREKGAERVPQPQDAQAGDFSIRMDIRSPRVRLRYLPWYLRDTSVIAWIVAGAILLVAFLVVSYVNDAVRLGFLPQVFARTNDGGFSASNFLYSFIPALIGHFLFLAMWTFDFTIRTLQPYMSLSSKGGATAEASLLVDYACRLPISVTLASLENKHYQTAVLSLVSFCSLAIPIIAGGCFWTQYYEGADTVRVSADLSGYYALCFFLALYIIGLVSLLPGRRRASLPHRSSSLTEMISWVYQSHIVSDRAFSRPQTKPELVTRLMGSAYLDKTWARSLTALVRPSRDNLRGDSPTDPALTEKKGKERQQREVNSETRNSVLAPNKITYGFGIHVGRDGLEHLGIDRVRRGGERSGREMVIFEEQRKRRSWAGSV